MVKKLTTSFLVFLLFLVSAVVLAKPALAEELTENVNYTLVGYEDVEESQFTGVLGSLVTIDLDTFKDEFLFYIHNGKVITEIDTQFVVSKSNNIIVVIENEEEHVTVFLDSNGALLEAGFVDGFEFTKQNPTKPGLNFVGFNNHANTDQVKIATYELQDNDAVVITVEGGTSSPQDVKQGEVVTLEPANPEAFTYWADEEGQLVSTNPKYKFTAAFDLTLIAVHDETHVLAPNVYLTNVTGIREGAQSFLGYVDLVEGLTLVEYGVLASEEAEVLTHETTGVKVIPSTSLTVNNEFLRTFTEGMATSFRGYAIFDNGTELVTVYSENNFIFEEVLPSILEVRQEEVNSNVKFKGIVTGFTDYVTEYSNYDKVFLEDGTASIVVYRAEFPKDLEIGDEFIVEGSVDVYRGLIQIAQGATVTLNSKGNELQTPTTITDLDDITIDLQAQRVSFEGTIKSISSTGQIMVVDLDGKEITIRSNSSSNSDPVNEHILTGKVDQKVRIIGMNVDWFDGKQLLPIMVSQIELLEPTDAEKIEQIELLLSEYNEQTYDMGTDVPFITTDPLYDVAIAWTYDNEELVVDGKFIAPNNHDEQVMATATFTVGETVATYDIVFTIKYIEAGSLIEEIIYETGFESSEGFESSTTYNNTTLKEEGPEGGKWGTYYGTPSTNSAISGSQSMQMRWYTSATTNFGYSMTMFDLSNISKVEFSAKNTNGINVDVEVSKDGGLTWENIQKYTLTTSAKEYTYLVPAALRTEQNRVKFTLTYTNKPSKTSNLYIDDVKIYGMVEFNPLEQDVEAIEFEKYDDIVNDLVLPELGAINGSTISWSSSNVAVISENGVLTLPELTETVILTATATDGTNTYEKEFAFTVTGVRTRIEALLELINLPIQTDENLVLPEVTEDNDSITWTSSNTAVITNEGVVTRPTDENTIVILTATIVEAGYTMIKTFEVVVVAEGSAVVEPITIKLTESAIWDSKNNSYANGNFEKDFSGMIIKADDSGFYTGSTYGDNKIQVKKGSGWIYNSTIPEGYIIKSITVNGQTSGKVNIYLSETSSKPNTNVISGVSTTDDISSSGFKYFYIKENNTQSGTVTIESIIIELIPN